MQNTITPRLLVYKTVHELMILMSSQPYADFKAILDIMETGLEKTHTGYRQLYRCVRNMLK